MASSLSVPVKQLDSSLPVPTYAYTGDAGLDLHAACSETLQPFERKLIPCGLALAIPTGFAGLLLPRSGLAAKHGISLVNAPGLIDSNYRGELKAILINLDPKTSFTIKQGDRIAQLLIIKIPTVSLNPVSELPATNRGAEGFGSSGIGC